MVFFFFFNDIYLYISNVMSNLEIVNDYRNGINVSKLEKKYHTSSKKVRIILLENGIDIHDPNRDFGPRRKMPNGYWKVKENNEKAASECRNRREFHKKHCVAYQIAKANGWISEYDEKYFSKEIKYASFSDKVHVVYVYEIPDFNAAYVGRTLDLKRRHNCHKNSTQNDSVYKFCAEHGIRHFLKTSGEQPTRATDGISLIRRRQE